MMTPAAPAPRQRDFWSRLPQGFAAFKHRNYRLFWFGQLISVTGTWMQSLAQSWLVLTLTPSAFLLGLVSVFQFAPVLLIGLFAGVIVDRVPKRKLLVGTQAISGVLAGTLAILTFTGLIQLWMIYVLAFSLGMVNALDMPTRQAFVVELVGKEDLMNGIALNSSLFNAARIIGPAVAGLLLAAFGPAVCFALNAVSYIAVIWGLMLMKVGPRLAIVKGRSMQQLRDGLVYVRTTTDVLRPILLVGMVATFGMNFNVWIPLLAKQDLNSGAGGFGLLMAASGVGSLIGALALAFMMKTIKRWMFFSTAAVIGGLDIILGIIGAIPLAIGIAMLVFAFIGFASTTTMAMANTTVQTTAPDELRGRVMSVYTTVFAGTAPFGALFAGAIANRFGTPVSLMLGGIITMAAVAAIALWREASAPSIRELARLRWRA
jgi:MFS family permease